jgi:purine nucleoside permease
MKCGILCCWCYYTAARAESSADLEVFIINCCRCFVPACLFFAQTPEAIPIKVVVVTMFGRGEDTPDTPGEYQLWAEREHLDRVIPLAAGYYHVRINRDGVLGLLTGVGTAKAAASVMTLGLDADSIRPGLIGW